MIAFGSTTGITLRFGVDVAIKSRIWRSSGFLRITDIQFQHEAIELRFRQLIRAFLFERILRGQHEERIGEGISLVADRDLPFLHRFEQGALHLGGGAIDFVRQESDWKKRAELGRELAGARIVDQGANQVRRQQIGRELQTLRSGCRRPLS